MNSHQVTQTVQEQLEVELGLGEYLAQLNDVYIQLGVRVAVEGEGAQQLLGSPGYLRISASKEFFLKHSRGALRRPVKKTVQIYHVRR